MDLTKSQRSGDVGVVRVRGLTRGQLLRGAAAASAGGAGAALAACATPQGSAPAAGNTPVTLTLWDRKEALYPSYMEKWLPTFYARRPHITVDYVATGEANSDKFIPAAAAGTPPDVLMCNGRQPRNHFENKLIVPLDKYIRASRLDTDDFLQGIYKGFGEAGQQFGIPQFVNVNFMFYNRTAFQRAGVPFPKDDWTHDQLLDTARRLTQGPLSSRETWGIGTPFSAVTVRVASLLWGQCAQFTDPKDNSVFTWGAAENLKAFQWAHDIAWRQRLAPLNEAERGGLPLVDAFFTRGNVAILLEGGHWIAEWKAKAQVEWDVAALPKGPCGRGERGAMDAYLMPAGVKTPDASWQLIEAITDKEANKLRSDVVNLPPARKSQWDHWSQGLPDKNLKVGVPTDSVRPDPGSYFHPDVQRALGPIWVSLFDRNEISVADALKQAREATAGVVGAEKSR